MNYYKIRFYLKFIFPLILIMLAFVIPTYSIEDVSNYLSVVSLLFTILIGFFIASATTNYFRLQSLIAAEDGGLITLFNLGKLVSPKSREKIADIIDHYSICSLNYDLVDFVEKSQPEFDQVMSVIDDLEAETKKGEELLQVLHQEKANLLPTRYEARLAAKRIITGWHWLIIGFLAIILNILVFAIRDGGIMTSFIAAGILLASYFSLLLIYEVDSNRFLEGVLSYENSQRIFEVIGKPRYYPEEALYNRKNGKPKGTYRLGVLKNPKTFEREIKIVEA